MLNPAIGKLIGGYDNRYRLVLEVAAKARKISEKANADGEIITEKPVSLAIDELAAKLDD
ncbi:MAG: DNA-directed RNA polymerase subunit omega [Clostridiales bacterium]|nr:DNA-directed RNA polymerase subunit omega [Candidatus Equinaster intestinalis]